MSTVKIILAKARNGIIGLNNTIPWKIAEDMAYFKQMTTGGTVIMGRKTWESLPVKYRPLPCRQNIIVTHNKDYRVENALVCHSLEEAIESACYENVWIIGGLQIYQQAEKYASELYVTLIHKDYEGDTQAPMFTGWQLDESTELEKTKDRPALSFIKLVRRTGEQHV